MKINKILVIFPLMIISPLLFAGSCFCLQDSDDNFRHSCSSQTRGLSEFVLCHSDDGKPYEVNSTDGWKILADGEGDCLPCIQQEGFLNEGAIRDGGVTHQKSASIVE